MVRLLCPPTLLESLLCAILRHFRESCKKKQFAEFRGVIAEDRRTARRLDELRKDILPQIAQEYGGIADVDRLQSRTSEPCGVLPDLEGKERGRTLTRATRARRTRNTWGGFGMFVVFLSPDNNFDHTWSHSIYDRILHFIFHYKN